METTDRPIGYWLKHLDNLINARFDATLSQLNLDRRGWQVLNLLHKGPQTGAQIEQALAPFWPNRDPGAPDIDRSPDLGAVLDGPGGLIARGLVRTGQENGFALTEDGRTVQAAAATRVTETRVALLRGLEPQQYAETVRILSVMAANLESAHPGRPELAAPAAPLP